MAKKADLEQAYTEYIAVCQRVATAVTEHRYSAVITLADSALPMLRDALAYQRKFQKDKPPLMLSVDYTVRYAPPLFAHQPLTRLNEWWAGLSRSEKAYIPDVSDRLDHARGRLVVASEMYSGLFRPALGRPVPEDADTRAVWLKLGVVYQSAGGWKPVTDVRNSVWAKCSRCGHRRQATQTVFLEPLSCPRCRQMCEFVISQRVV